VPGGPGRASAYLEDLGGLARDRTLLLLDLRGTGRSELPADRDSLAFPRLADDVEDVRRALGLHEVDVLGHSAGCHVALVHAARYPGSVRRLVLVTPSANGLADYADIQADVMRIRSLRSGEPWYAEVSRIQAEMAMLPENQRHRMERGLRPFFYGRWDEHARAHAAATDSQMSLRATAAFRPGDADPAELPRLMRDVDAPTLVMVGGLDGITGVIAGRIVAEHLPNAQPNELAEVAGSGHYPWIDEPAAFAAAVAGFLAG
jgi:pimeloyl-ACP methyl ester carboxylesterase